MLIFRGYVSHNQMVIPLKITINHVVFQLTHGRGKKPFSGNTAHLRPAELKDEDLAQPADAAMMAAARARGEGPREVAF
jgi:hypothetical protein